MGVSLKCPMNLGKCPDMSYVYNGNHSHCTEVIISMQWLHTIADITTEDGDNLMETFSALLAICVGNSPVPGKFPTQRPVTRNFDVFFDLRPNKLVSK